MTPEQANEAKQRVDQKEKELQEDIKKYLEENPFPENDYAAQKAAYEKLVERVLRMEKYLYSHSHDMRF